MAFNIKVKVLDVDIYFKERKLGTLQYSPGYECCFTVLKVHTNVLLNCADEYKHLPSIEMPNFDMVYRSKWGYKRRVVRNEFDMGLVVGWTSKNMPGEYAKVKLSIVVTSTPGFGPLERKPLEKKRTFAPFTAKLYSPFLTTVRKFLSGVRRAIIYRSS